MSIAKTGPANYDFQDRVCIEMMLRFYGYEDAQFLVEPQGGEDCEIVFGSSKSNQRVEIQVKGANEPVTLDTIASILAHFESYKSQNTLLERLLSSSNHYVVLVMNGRCDDAASLYVPTHDWQGQQHKEGKIKQKNAQEILDAVGVTIKVSEKSTELDKKRAAHCEKLQLEIKKTLLQAALHRLIIIERVSDTIVTTQCSNYLIEKHRIPRDKVDDVIRNMESKIKIAKNKQIDAFPLIRAVINSAMPSPIKPLGYLERGDEALWLEALERDHVLLLSGPPRTGKSNAACWIAAKFEPFGYEIDKFNETGRAERFLLEPSNEARLAILDDPLGGTYQVPNLNNEFARIRSIIRQLQPHRKLIVAQSQEVLLVAASRSKLADVQMNGIDWFDLDKQTPTFRCKVWLDKANKNSLPKALIEVVSTALASGECKFEPGCLDYLVNCWDQLAGSLDINHITKLARADADTLGKALVEEGFATLLNGLAINAGPFAVLQASEFVYINSSDSQELPGKPVKGLSGMIWSTDSTAEFAPPKYTANLQLADEDADKIELLQQRGILSVTEAKENGDIVDINFTHPYYRAAAEASLKKPTKSQINKILRMVERGLFCLEPMTSCATARNFDWLFALFEDKAWARKKLVDLAIDGLCSYFPVTRDFCFRFLVRNLSTIDVKQVNLKSWTWSINSIELSSLQWIKGAAWIPIGFPMGNGYLEAVFSVTDANEVKTELTLCNSSENVIINAAQAANVLSFYKNKPNEMTALAVGRLLSFDEGVIRAAAAKVWLSIIRTNDQHILERLFNDEHPSVALAALQGAIKGWGDYGQSRRAMVMKGLVDMATLVSNAVTMLDHLVIFERGAVTPWALFADLFPVVLHNLPLNSKFSDARFFNVVREAVPHVSVSNMLVICDSWLTRLKHLTDNEHLPSEFELGVVDILMKVTEQQPEQREDRIERLLAFKGTGALLVFLKDLLDWWEDLTKEEQVVVQKLINTNRLDSCWLKGLVLTRNYPPAILVSLILTDTNELTASPTNILKSLEPSILVAALQLYTGEPGLLYALNTHGCANDIWQPVVELIAMQPSHPFFELAWLHVTRYDADQNVVTLIENIGTENLDVLLDLMIKIKIDCIDNLPPETWTAILNLAPNDDVRDGMIKKMVTYAPAIISTVRDLRLWLPKGQERDSILNELPIDNFLMQIMRVDVKYFNVTDTDFVNDLIGLIKGLVEKGKPKLKCSCQEIINLLQNLGIEAPTLVDIMQTHDVAINEEIERIKESQKLVSSTIAHWLTP